MTKLHSNTNRNKKKTKKITLFIRKFVFYSNNFDVFEKVIQNDDLDEIINLIFEEEINPFF